MLYPRCRRVLLLLVFFCLALPGRDGSADEAQDFRKHYEQALVLYENGQYQESIQEFQAAYAIKQLPKLLLNMGQAHRKLGHAKDALGYYEFYLRVEPNPEPKLKAELDRYIVQTRVMLEAAERVRAESMAARHQAESERVQDQQLAKPVLPPASGKDTAEAPAAPAAALAPAASSVRAVTQPSVGVTANEKILPKESSPERPSSPEPNRPIYKRAWFWGVMGVVGAVVVGGVITGTALAIRGPGIPDDIQIQNWSLRGRQ